MTFQSAFCPVWHGRRLQSAGTVPGFCLPPRTALAVPLGTGVRFTRLHLIQAGGISPRWPWLVLGGAGWPRGSRLSHLLAAPWMGQPPASGSGGTSRDLGDLSHVPSVSVQASGVAKAAGGQSQDKTFKCAFPRTRASLASAVSVCPAVPGEAVSPTRRSLLGAAGDGWPFP